MSPTKHRVTVWAGGVNGYPVTCTCGWKTYAKSAREGYAKRTEHIKANKD